MAESAFQPGYEYLKAKVIATDLVPTDEIQGSLFSIGQDCKKGDRLMTAMDQINRKLGKDSVKFAALGLKPTWEMRSDFFSQRYTTHWQEIPMVKMSSTSSFRQDFSSNQIPAKDVTQTQK